MRLKLLITALITLLLPMAAIAVPASALASPSVASAGPGADIELPTCAAAPDSEDATPENRDRFVRLWAPRVADKDFIERWNRRDQVTSSVRDEGFHAMAPKAQAWLTACLLDHLLEKSGEDADRDQRFRYFSSLGLVIFGKDEIKEMREDFAKAPETAPDNDTRPDPHAGALDEVEGLEKQDELAPGDRPEAEAPAPATTIGNVSRSVRAGALPDVLRVPPLPQLLDAVASLQRLVAGIERRLFTLPVLNLLAPAFYKICAESPTMPLSCSISLPVGVPIPADVDGDRVPDVLGALLPVANLVDAGATFQVTRLNANSGPLKAHVFAVYDTPIGNKRIEVGFDGRTSTLGFNSGVTFSVRNILRALTGDVQVAAQVKTVRPGATESLSFAVKSLSGSSRTESDPVAGSIQMNPFPREFKVGARLTHSGSSDQSTINIESLDPTSVDVLVDQNTTSATPRSRQRFTAAIENLPDEVTVDVLRNGSQRTVDYRASETIDSVSAGLVATPDVTRAGTFSETTGLVEDVPDHVTLGLTGSDDVRYAASSEVPRIAFATRAQSNNVQDYALSGEAQGIPAAMHVNAAGSDLHYEASDSIDLVRTHVSRAGGDDVVAEVTDIPSRVDLLLAAADSTIDWKASAPTGGIDVAAHLSPATVGGQRSLDAALALRSIPARWDAAWGSGAPHFKGSGDGIGSISAEISNHGSVHRADGNHLSAFYDASTGDADASLKVTHLREAGLTKLNGSNGGGFDAELDLGEHDPFALLADVRLSSGLVKAAAAFSAVPNGLNLRSSGGRITYTGTGSTDLTMAVEAGTAAALASTPEAPSVHGVSVRDGEAAHDYAVKSRMYLTGLPTRLDLDSTAGVYEVAGYHPSVDTLAVDAVLNRIAPEPLSLQVELGVPTASPVDVKFGPFRTATAADKSHTVDFDYVANQPLGALSAEVRYGDHDQARVETSSIPATIAVDAALGKDLKTVGVALSEPIEDLTVQYKKPGALVYAATATLGDVPTAVNLRIGEETGSDVSAQGFSLNASQPGLDFNAHVGAQISDPVDAQAEVSFISENLGRTVSGGLDGRTLRLASVPSTDVLRVEGAATVTVGKDLDFRRDASIFTLVNEGRVDATITVNKLLVGFDDLVNAQLDLGLTTGLQGDYEDFFLKTDVDAFVHLEDDLDLEIEWPIPGENPTTSFDLFSIDRDFNLENLIDGFHVSENNIGRVVGVSATVLAIYRCESALLTRPGPGEVRGRDGLLRLRKPPPAESEGPAAWLITPNVNLAGLGLPSFGLDLIAWFSSPYGHDYDITTPSCGLIDPF